MKKTGITLQNDDGLAELPIYFTKRQMYCNFMYGCGQIVKPKVTGIFGELKEYKMRGDSNDWVSIDENSIHPCSFETF